MLRFTRQNGHIFRHGSDGEPLDQAIHPVEAGISRHTDLVQLFIALGALVNRPTRNSLGQYVNSETLRTYLDWVRFAIVWIQNVIGAEKSHLEKEIKKAEGIISAPTTPWKAFAAKTIFLPENNCLPDSEKYKEHIAKIQADSETNRPKYLQLKGFFEDVERLLMSKGAQTYNELFPESEKPSTAKAVVMGQFSYAQPPNTTRFVFLGQHFSSDTVPLHLSAKYDELFEACWRGDDDTVRRLCLPEEEKQNALRVSVAVAGTNAWARTSMYVFSIQFMVAHSAILLDLTPFVAAIENRQWTTARLVFCICVAQYKPADEKEVPFKLGKFTLGMFISCLSSHGYLTIDPSLR